MRIVSFVLIVAASLVLVGCVSSPDPQAIADAVNQPSVYKPVNQIHENQVVAKANVKLAIDLMEKGEYPQAKAKLLVAQQQDPAYVPTYYTLGYYYQKINDRATATHYYQKAIKIAPQDPLVLNAYGVFLCQTGQYKASLTYFHKAIAISSYDHAGLAYENAGMCASKIPNIKLAFGYFQKAVATNPQLTDAYYMLAALAYQLKMYMNAEYYLHQYNQMAKPSKESLQLGIAIAEKLGNKNQVATLQSQLNSIK